MNIQNDKTSQLSNSVVRGVLIAVTSVMLTGCAELVRVPVKVITTSLDVTGKVIGFASDTLTGTPHTSSRPAQQSQSPQYVHVYTPQPPPVKVEPVFSCSQPVITVSEKTRSNVTIKVRFQISDEKNRGSRLVLNERFWISKREVDIGRKRNNVDRAGREVISELILTRKEFRDLQRFPFTYSYEVTNDRGRQCFASSTVQIARK